MVHVPHGKDSLGEASTSPDASTHVDSEEMGSLGKASSIAFVGCHPRRLARRSGVFEIAEHSWHSHQGHDTVSAGGACRKVRHPRCTGKPPRSTKHCKRGHDLTKVAPLEEESRGSGCLNPRCYNPGQGRMEVSKEWDHQAGRYVWLISQSSYVEDLLNAGEDKPKSRKIPITRDQAGMEQSEDLPTAQIRSAQKVVGELLWLDEDQT